MKVPAPLREYSVTVLALLAALAIVFFSVLFQGRTLLPADLIDTMTLPFSHYFAPEHAYNSLIVDGALQFYPLEYFTKLAYEHGHVAFWNPFILNGYPQYLDILGGGIYNLLLFLPMSIAFPFVLLFPLLVAGVGMYALLRAYAVRTGIARLFATAYMLNALFIAHLLTHFIPCSFSFAPWVILFLYRYSEERQYNFLPWASMFLALGFISGNLQTVGFLIILSVLYLGSICLAQPHRSMKSLIKPLAIVVGFATGLSAILLIPMIELFQQTMAHGAFFSTSLLRSYNFLQRLESLGLILTFFIPQLAGSNRGVLLHQVIGVYPQDFEGAIGFLPLFIAVWGSITLWRRRSEIRPFAILMLAGIALPIATPLFHFLYHRFFVIFAFGACGAGAIGLESILKESSSRSDSLKKWITGFVIALVGIVLVLMFLTLIRIFDFNTIEMFAQTHLLPRLRHIVFSEGNAAWVAARFRETLDYWSITRTELDIGIGTSLIALALIAWKHRLSSQVFLLCAWLVTVLQLGCFVYSWFPTSRASQYPLYPSTPETTLLEHMAKNSRAYCYREVDSARQFVFMDNQNVIYGIPEATGYESITPRSLYIYTAVLHWRDSGLVTPELLGKFNIGTLVRAKPLPFDSLQCIESGPLWIYRNPFVFPRAYLAHRAIVVVNDSEALSRMNDASLVWPAAYFTSSEYIHPFSNALGDSDRISIQHSGNNSIALTAYSRDSSYLLLTDTYYPGWQATIDGKSAPILRANYAMRAVLLPPGLHTVMMRFDPLSFRVGMWISLGSLLFFIAFIFHDVRQIRIGDELAERRIQNSNLD